MTMKRKDEGEKPVTKSSVIQKMRAIAREIGDDEWEPETLEAIDSLLDDVSRELGLD